MTHKWVTCYRCKTQFAMAEDIFNLAHQRAEEISFWCPNGHSQVFSKGKTEAEKLRDERDKLTQRLAEWQDYEAEQRKRAEALERKLSASKGQITRIKKRAANGVCPCCNRTFSDLAKHMAGKHPGFVSEPTADEHVH